MKPYVAKDSKVTAITPYQLTKQILYKEGKNGMPKRLNSSESINSETRDKIKTPNTSHI